MKRVTDSEGRFFDSVFGSDGRESVSGFYELSRCSREYYGDYLLTNCPGKRVLECGCGTGSYALGLAGHASEIVGIDVSEVGIKLAEEEARKRGAGNVAFLRMDAEEMKFGDSCFDMVCGMGILHHLALDEVLAEMARVLKPDGKAVFLEPMGHNPFINLFRRLTPNLRTADEHPLTVRDLELVKGFFQQVDCRFFCLSSLLAVSFHNTRALRQVVGVLDKMDTTLFELIPPLKAQAWQVVIILEKPDKRA